MLSFRTLLYKHNFMANLRYKNFFITKTFREIDEKRSMLNMDCVLPLTRSERKSFVELTSFQLVKHEYKMIFQKGIFMLMSTLHLSGILLVDYSLFWLLAIVQFHGNESHEAFREDKGCGLMTDMIILDFNLFLNSS